ncbi:sulfatase-like hydrolase/transferase [Mesonia aquimarina]|uniref:sulfatase-like hydrolase/transferase n=1 Tax=Mesonia aquimarina TaxID=1504967 RepID=UPI0019694DEF|nr:sulfatase-like hydrolase/transferase [Mesonia aquimarina]
MPYLIIKSTKAYWVEQQKMNNSNISSSKGHFTQVSKKNKKEQELFVLVIGESTTRNHMNIYGYPRETTPRLNLLKNELDLYQNVISPHTYTIETLKQNLTLNGFKKSKESSIVQLMNQAGFKTFWFSNQQPIGPFDSMVTEIAKASDILKFTNLNRHSHNTPYDGVLLDNLIAAVKDPAKRKFIVIHLLGTHLNYGYRFPERFNKFNKSPEGKYKDKKAIETINNYDNAVLYVDYVLAESIEILKQANLKSYLLYFSDHGEEVYQSRYFSGHTLSKATKNMFEIPFILWRSEKFKKAKFISKENYSKPYVTDDLIHSISDLSDVDFEELLLNKSIFSDQFIPKKRIVGEGINFDNYRWNKSK